ncbi:hypothetical protein Tco_0761978 [Tanacetum coccineum]
MLEEGGVGRHVGDTVLREGKRKLEIFIQLHNLVKSNLVFGEKRVSLLIGTLAREGPREDQTHVSTMGQVQRSYEEQIFCWSLCITTVRCCYHTSGWSASHGQPNIVPGGVGAAEILVSNEMLEPGCPIRKAWIGWGLGLRMVSYSLYDRQAPEYPISALDLNPPEPSSDRSPVDSGQNLQKWVSLVQSDSLKT